MVYKLADYVCVICKIWVWGVDVGVILNTLENALKSLLFAESAITIVLSLLLLAQKSREEQLDIKVVYQRE